MINRSLRRRSYHLYESTGGRAEPEKQGKSIYFRENSQSRDDSIFASGEPGTDFAPNLWQSDDIWH